MADKTPEEIEAEKKAAELEAAQKLVAEEDAKAAREAEKIKAARRSEREKRVSKAGKDATLALVRYVSAEVHNAVPHAARQHGNLLLPEDHPYRMPERNIPDGSYRVMGRDWILRFEDGHLVEMTMGRPTSEPSDYLEFE